jgi:hypothetical protein
MLNYDHGDFPRCESNNSLFTSLVPNCYANKETVTVVAPHLDVPPTVYVANVSGLRQ